MKACGYLLSFNLLLLVTVGCGNQNKAYVEQRAAVNIASTVSVEDHWPDDGAVGLDPFVPIIIDFSEPIAWKSVNFFSFRVENEFGDVIPGKISLSSDGRSLSYQPLRNGQEAPLPTETTFTVIARFLQDESDNFIAPYFYQFRTRDGAQTTGAFKALRALPNSKYVTAQDLNSSGEIAVEFNEEIFPGPGGANCHTDYFSAAMQVGVMQLLDNAGSSNFVPLNPSQICIKMNAEGKYKLLVFKVSPETPVPDGLIPRLLQIRVFSTPELVGEFTGQMLADEAVFDKRIDPSPLEILQALGLIPPSSP